MNFVHFYSEPRGGFIGFRIMDILGEKKLWSVPPLTFSSPFSPLHSGSDEYRNRNEGKSFLSPLGWTTRLPSGLSQAIVGQGFAPILIYLSLLPLGWIVNLVNEKAILARMRVMRRADVKDAKKVYSSDFACLHS